MYKRHGSESTGFLPFLDAIMDTDIPVTQLAPTHCNRSNKVLEESVKFGLSGGFVDVTTSFMSVSYTHLDVYKRQNIYSGLSLKTYIRL